MSDIGLMVRAANPVPDDSSALTDDELGAVFLLARQRSTDMDIKEMTTPVTRDEKPKRGWLIGVAAAAVVVLIVGAVVLLIRSTDDVAPATTPSTTIGVSPTTTETPPTTAGSASVTSTTSPTTTTVAAEPVLDAEAVALLDQVAGLLNAGDHEAASSIVASAAEFVGEPGIPNDQRARFITKYELWIALDSVVSIDDCSTSSAGFTRCVLSRTSEREALAATPQESTITIRVADGELMYFEQAPVLTNPWWIEQGRLEDWLNENHPDVYIAAYFSPTDAVVAADLREEYTQLWDAAGRP